MLPERLKNRLILTRSVHDFLDYLQLRVPLGYEFPESYSEAIIFYYWVTTFLIVFVYSAWDRLLTSQTVVFDGARIVVISSFELPEQSPETISNAGLFCTIISSGRSLHLSVSSWNHEIRD